MPNKVTFSMPEPATKVAKAKTLSVPALSVIDATVAPVRIIKVSLPSPPTSVSVPPVPVSIISLPLPPEILLLPELPVRRLAESLPVILAAEEPDKETFSSDLKAVVELMSIVEPVSIVSKPPLSVLITSPVPTM
nr:hypothetical protein [Methylocucumis oryzae]